MPDSVAGIVKVNNKFLLGKRKPGGAIGGKWEFPGGKVENNEPLEDALKREYKEELGIEIEVKDFIIAKNFESIDHNFKLHAFYIKLLSNDIKCHEHELFKWCTLNEIIELENNLASSDKILLEHLS